MIVIFDRQHYGKPNRPNDLGAAVDLDGDGQIATGEREAMLTPYYYGPAKAMLEEMGHTVYVLDAGWYSDRHKRACEIAANNPGMRVAYLACHINAGGGDYAVMIHDERSGGGSALANHLSAAIYDHNLTGIRRSLVRAASADNAWKRGYTTIKGIYSGPANISGVCLEPFFIDRPDHQWLASVQGGKALASALVDGLVRWSAGA
jgi:hypothetical protein